MLLLTVGLILVGFVLLLIGLFADVYALVIGAIGCALAAGLVLLAYSRVSRRTAAPAQAGGSAPAPAGAPAQAWSPPPPRPEPEPAPAWAPPPLSSEPTVTIETIGSADAPEAQAEPPDTAVVAPVSAASGPSDDEVEFPIADYDELRVSEILPLLPELDLDELEVVRERELAGKRRSAVVDRIDEEMDELEGEAVPVAAAPVTPVAAAPAAGRFPIADYERRSVSEIVALIPDLSDDELDELAEREEQGQNRAAVLDAIDDQFEEVEIGDEELVPAVSLPVAEVPVKKAPVKKVIAKKVMAKKVPARKVPAKKVPAKKVVAKKVPAKKIVVKKVPAKKIVVKKLGVKKGPAKKVAVKGVKSPRTSAVKKVTVKKVVKKVGRPAKKR